MAWLSRSLTRTSLNHPHCMIRASAVCAFNDAFFGQFSCRIRPICRPAQGQIAKDRVKFRLLLRKHSVDLRHTLPPFLIELGEERVSLAGKSIKLSLNIRMLGTPSRFPPCVPFAEAGAIWSTALKLSRYLTTFQRLLAGFLVSVGERGKGNPNAPTRRLTRSASFPASVLHELGFPEPCRSLEALWTRASAAGGR